MTGGCWVIDPKTGEKVAGSQGVAVVEPKKTTTRKTKAKE